VLTIQTIDPRGHVIDVRWLCDSCEAAELKGRGIPPMRHGQVEDVSLGRFGTERLMHGDNVEAPECHGCCELG
jgi:hypothetical protein